MDASRAKLIRLDRLASQVGNRRIGSHVPLLIDFKAGDKMIINGAVIENTGAGSKLLIHNRAAILRGREILSEEDTQTPAARIYFALKCAYMFADKKDDYLTLFSNFLGDYVDACPSAKEIADKIRALVDDGHLYKGLKATQDLIKHESKLLRSVHEDVEKSGESTQQPESD